MAACKREAVAHAVANKRFCSPELVKLPSCAVAGSISIDGRDDEKASPALEEAIKELRRPNWKAHHLFLAKLLQSRVPRVADQPAALPDCRAGVNLTVCVDLDQTLLHTWRATELAAPGALRFQGGGCEYKVLLRPGAVDFLHALRSCTCGSLELVLFTAGKRHDAEKKLRALGASRNCFHHYLFRDSCILSNRVLVKDLSILGRPLSRIVLIDDCPFCFAYQLDNGVHVEPWVGQENDAQLLSLLPLLKFLASQPTQDVRPVLRRALGVRAAVDGFEPTLTQMQEWRRNGISLSSRSVAGEATKRATSRQTPHEQSQGPDRADPVGGDARPDVPGV
eukprot:TRINITY_DN60384_c0_g1_i1.p1 TRINITY_DN60384_c0_g1~~TRINITY_DN60384_c0_g1_i1.p1  ORF type:complete len:337 (-),score=38.19 TRINITY_DN60384_c0_g1_i1:266-1276(-)